MINSCPRFDSKRDALLWLAEELPELHDVYVLFSNIIDGDQINGIPVFQQSIADELDKIHELPLWFNGEVTMIPVDSRSLYWEIETELDEAYESELGVEMESYYAATALLNSVINLNISATFVCSAIDEVSFSKSLQVYLDKLNHLEAGILKMAASEITESYVIKALRARHMTISRKARNFYVPAKEFDTLLTSRVTLNHLIVVDGNYAYCHKAKGAAELLGKMGINVEHIVECGLGKLSWLVNHVDLNKDTIVSTVFRHPIIGYVAFGSTKPAEINGIGVPADISEKLDGDDDGDIIDLVPLVVLRNQQVEFVSTTLD